MLRRTILLFFLLFVFTSTFSIALSQMSLGICIALFLVLAGGERFNPFGRRLKWFWVAAAVYLGWLLIVCLAQDSPSRALDHIREEWLFLIIPVGIYLMRDRSNLERMVAALAGGVLLVTLASVIMSFIGVEYHWGGGFETMAEPVGRLRGNFAHALTYGNFAAVASTFLIAWLLSAADRGMTKLKWLTLASVLAGTAGTVAASSRGSILALAFGMFGLVFLTDRRHRRWAVAVLIVFLTVGVSIPSIRERFTTDLQWQLKSEWSGGRLFIWGRSLEMIRDNPVTGVGPGNFSENYKARIDPGLGPKYEYPHAHNDFLQAAVRAGLPGGVAFVLLWVAAMYYLWTGRRRAGPDSEWRGVATASLLASLAFLVSSMTEATFADEEVRALLMLVWAVGLAGGYNSGEGEPTPI